jgi:hypothetical protein
MIYDDINTYNYLNIALVIKNTFVSLKTHEKLRYYTLSCSVLFIISF